MARRRSPTAYPDPADVTWIASTRPLVIVNVATTELPTPVSDVNSTPVNVPSVRPIPAEVSDNEFPFKPSGPPTDTILPLFAPCLISLPATNVVVVSAIETLCLLEYAVTGLFFLILPSGSSLL